MDIGNIVAGAEILKPSRNAISIEKRLKTRFLTLCQAHKPPLKPGAVVDGLISDFCDALEGGKGVTPAE